MHGHPRCPFVNLANGIEFGEFEVRVNPLRIHVEGDRHDVQVAGAFAVAEEGAFHTVGSRHEPQFGGCCASAAVVVGMQADGDFATLFHFAGKPLDLVGVQVGGKEFDGGRKVKDDGILLGRFPCIDHCFADFEGILQLSV